MAHLVTERLFLRPYRAGEHDLARTLLADPRVTFWRDHPLSEDFTRTLFEERMALRAQGLGWWAVFLNDRVGSDGAPVLVGQVILQPLAESEEIEIGWLFSPEHWGHGYATEAARAVLGHAFDTLGLERIVAVVLPDNERSLGVIHKLGFEEGNATIHAGRPHRYFVLRRSEQSAISAQSQAAGE